jgi:hypothetical protein
MDLASGDFEVVPSFSSGAIGRAGKSSVIGRAHRAEKETLTGFLHAGGCPPKTKPPNPVSGKCLWSPKPGFCGPA